MSKSKQEPAKAGFLSAKAGFFSTEETSLLTREMKIMARAKANKKSAYTFYSTESGETAVSTPKGLLCFFEHETGKLGPLGIVSMMDMLNWKELDITSIDSSYFEELEAYLAKN